MSAAEQIRAADYARGYADGRQHAEADYEREHADRVWLTRDEAIELRNRLVRGMDWTDGIALLDERLGDK